MEISDDRATPEDALGEHRLDAYSDIVAEFSLEDVGPENLELLHRALRQRAIVSAEGPPFWFLRPSQ